MQVPTCVATLYTKKNATATLYTKKNATATLYTEKHATATLYTKKHATTTDHHVVSKNSTSMQLCRKLGGERGAAACAHLSIGRYWKYWRHDATHFVHNTKNQYIPAIYNTIAKTINYAYVDGIQALQTRVHGWWRLPSLLKSSLISLWDQSYHDFWNWYSGKTKALSNMIYNNVHKVDKKDNNGDISQDMDRQSRAIWVSNMDQAQGGHRIWANWNATCTSNPWNYMDKCQDQMTELGRQKAELNNENEHLSQQQSQDMKQNVCMKIEKDTTAITESNQYTNDSATEVDKCQGQMTELGRQKAELNKENKLFAVRRTALEKHLSQQQSQDMKQNVCMKIEKDTTDITESNQYTNDSATEVDDEGDRDDMDPTEDDDSDDDDDGQSEDTGMTTKWLLMMTMITMMTMMTMRTLSYLIMKNKVKDVPAKERASMANDIDQGKRNFKKEAERKGTSDQERKRTETRNDKNDNT
ncbi:unnamed protein product [Absidia cylindrospora]